MEWRSGYTNFNTSARPAIAAFGGQYHLFFKDDGTNDGIMHVISDNGEAWSRPRDFYIKWNTSSGPCPVATDERLHVFFRDSGNHDGLMHVAADDGFTFGAQDPFYLSQNVYAETRGAVSDDGTICLISRQAGSEDGSAMVRAVRRPGASDWDLGHTGANVKNHDIASIVVFREQFHVFFPDPNNNGDGIYHIVSNDGVNWVGAQPYYIGIDTSAGPSAVVCNGRLHLFFRDGGGNNGLMHAESEDGNQWSQPEYLRINTNSEPCSTVMRNPVTGVEQIVTVFQDRGNARTAGIMYVVGSQPDAAVMSAQTADPGARA